MADDLKDLRDAVAALESEAADGVDSKVVGRIGTTRRALIERRTHAQSGAELDACNALLDRLRKVYAP